MGEAGAEHLLMWCPATALAWQRFSPDNPNLLVAAFQGSVADATTPHFMHQMSYLHCAMVNAAEMPCERAAHRLLQALRTRDTNDDHDIESLEEPDATAQHDDLPVTVWDPAPPECDLCHASHTNAGVRGSSEPATRRTGLRGGGELCQRPVTQHDTSAGGVLAMLYSDDQTAGWIPPGRGWWPRPRRALAAEANAEWLTDRCLHCRCYVARLVATAHIRRRSEIIATNCPSPAWDEARWPFEATFDGWGSADPRVPSGLSWGHAMAA